MANVESVAVVHTIDDLSEIVGSFALFETTLFDQVIKELAALNVLQYQVSMLAESFSHRL